MSSRRLEAGPLIVAAGALLLLVSLFLAWFEPGLTAWEAFEVIDLLLAAAAILALLAALGAAGLDTPAVDERAIGWSAGVALVLVLSSLIDHPPAAFELDPDVGLWLGLAGTALMAAGALLSLARVRISLDVQARRTRMSAVDTRRPGEDDETAPLAPQPARGGPAGGPVEPAGPAESARPAEPPPPEQRL